MTLSITTLSIMTFRKMKFSIKRYVTLGIMTISTTTFRNITFSIIKSKTRHSA